MGCTEFLVGTIIQLREAISGLRELQDGAIIDVGQRPVICEENDLSLFCDCEDVISGALADSRVEAD